jgi:hypothetical protein
MKKQAKFNQELKEIKKNVTKKLNLQVLKIFLSVCSVIRVI